MGILLWVLAISLGQGIVMLSAIEKMIFLKDIPFFGQLSIEQLKVLGSLCEEDFFEQNAVIFREGEPGGALYIVVSGRVSITREALRKGVEPAQLATLGAPSYFGEMTLFDNGPRSASAHALQDTMLLRLRREPVIVLARQYPDLSLGLIQGISQRLTEAFGKISDLTPALSRSVHKIYDKLDV